MKIPPPLRGGRSPLPPRGEEGRGPFYKKKGSRDAPRVAGLALGKSSHCAWAFPGYPLC